MWGSLRRLVLVIGLAACGACSDAPRGPSVLLFVADTLRSDALGSYGSPLPASPRLDAFARDGMLFEQAIAPAPQTAPSHATMFTSAYPASHGVWNSLEPTPERRLHPELSRRAVTLAEVFLEAGYQTAAFADGGWVTQYRGLRQGFQVFDSEYRGVRDRVAAATAWLHDREPDRPFFLFVHTYEAHTPYLPPVGTEDDFATSYQGFLRELVEEIREEDNQGDLRPLLGRLIDPVREDPAPEHVAFLHALYHAEVREVDRGFAELLDALERLGLARSTLVAVTSDHGEEFGEHGGFSHDQAYEPLLRIPLLFAGPGVPRGVRRPEPAELTDLMPTLLRYVGLPVPASAVGRDLALRARAGPPPDPDRFIISEAPSVQQVAVRRGPLKAIFHEGGPPRAEVFDLSRDPGEAQDLSASLDGRFLREAREALRQHREAARRHREQFGLRPTLRESDGLSEAERQALTALGYLEGAPASVSEP